MKKVDFIIAGVGKSGTTSIMMLLRRHPDFFVIGESNFFSDNFEKGLDWYLSRFSGWSGEKKRGEKCPGYFQDLFAPRRIKKVFPEVKLVFCFRNPVDRAYSQYWQKLREGREGCVSFEDAVRNNSCYLDVGRYIIYVKQWLSFFPISQMFFLKIEELDTGVMQRLLLFLDGDPGFDFDVSKKYNVGGSLRSSFFTKVSSNRVVKKIPLLSDFVKRGLNMDRKGYPAMTSETRTKLDNYFMEYNQSFNNFFEKEGVDIYL